MASKKKKKKKSENFSKLYKIFRWDAEEDLKNNFINSPSCFDCLCSLIIDLLIYSLHIICIFFWRNKNIHFIWIQQFFVFAIFSNKDLFLLSPFSFSPPVLHRPFCLSILNRQQRCHQELRHDGTYWVSMYIIEWALFKFRGILWISNWLQIELNLLFITFDVKKKPTEASYGVELILICLPMTVDWWATPTIHWLLFASAANIPVTSVPWLKLKYNFFKFFKLNHYQFFKKSLFFYILSYK